jgi:hypothetical protein
MVVSSVLLIDDHLIILTVCRQPLQEARFGTLLVTQDASSR